MKKRDSLVACFEEILKAYYGDVNVTPLKPFIENCHNEPHRLHAYLNQVTDDVCTFIKQSNACRTSQPESFLELARKTTEKSRQLAKEEGIKKIKDLILAQAQAGLNCLPDICLFPEEVEYFQKEGFTITNIVRDSSKTIYW